MIPGESISPVEFNLGSPRKHRFRGAADEDVKSVLELLEKELGAVLR